MTSRLIVLVGVCLVLGVMLIARSPQDTTATSTAPAPQPVPQPPPSVDFAALIADRISHAELRNQAAIRAFQEQVYALVRRHEPALDQTCTQSAKELSTLSSCMAIIMRMGVDRVKGGCKTQDYLQRHLGPALDARVTALSQGLSRALAQLEQALDASALLLATDLAQIAPVGRRTHGRSLSVAPDGKLQQALSELGVNGAFLGIAIPLDLLAVSQTGIAKRLAGTTQRIAGRLFGKQVAKVAAGGALSLADGPLPIGDALALGLLGWTAYDVHRGPKRFQSDLLAALQADARNCVTAMQEDVMTRAASAVEAHEHFYSRVGTELAADWESL